MDIELSEEEMEFILLRRQLKRDEMERRVWEGEMEVTDGNCIRETTGMGNFGRSDY